MPTFAEQIVDTIFKGEPISEFEENHPFIFECLIDYFARECDIPKHRRFHPRAIDVRRRLALLFGTRSLVTKSLLGG